MVSPPPPTTTRIHRLKGEFRHLLVLALPIMATQITQMGMGFVDTVMAGRFSPDDLAAVAIGSSIWTPFHLLVTGIMLAVTPLTAHCKGSGDLPGIGRLFCQAIWLSLGLGLLFLLVILNVHPLLGWMGIDEPALTIATNYLAGIAWGAPGATFYIVMRCVSEGMSQTRPVLYITLLTLLLNIPANYILIYGKLGFPALGGAGCGWATAIALWFSAALMWCYTHTAKALRECRLYNSFQPPQPKAIATILKLGVPIGIAIFFENTLFGVIALFIASMGAIVVAGHQIVLNFTSLIFMIPLSIGISITIRSGQLLGRGKPAAARDASLAGILLALSFACISALAMLLIPGQIAAFYSPDTAVQAVAVSLFFYGAIFQFSDAIQVSAAGALRGYKDTRATMYITLIAYWLIGMPAGYILGMTNWVTPALGPDGFWIGLVIGLTVAALLLGYRLQVTSQRLIAAAPA